MKRQSKLISSIVLILLLVGCSSTKKRNQVINLLPVRNGIAYSYINQSGKISIAPQFKDATVFRDGLALVQVFGAKPLWGFISEDGNFAIKPKYKAATVFSEELAWVVSEDGVPVVINKRGETKFEFRAAKSVRIFKNGLAAFSVTKDSMNLKWGFIDKFGFVRIEPQYSAISDFSEGKCAVANASGEWEYIDVNGKQCINQRFKNAKDFVAGKAIVLLINQWGVIDEKGKFLISPQFSEMKADGEEYLIKQGNSWGRCNAKGDITLKPQFGDVYPFNGSKLAVVKSGDNYGYSTKRGKLMIDAQFESALPFNGKMAWVVRGKKGGFIDNDARYIIQPQYDSISNDFKALLLNEKSPYESVNSDYFNLTAIINRLKTDINENTVAGMNFSTSMSDIFIKFHKTDADFRKRDTEHQIITAERLSNDATLDFYILGTPWNEINNGNLRFTYELKPNYRHSGFSYRIKLSGKAIGKEDILLKTLEKSLAGYSVDVNHSKGNVIVLQSNSQIIICQKETGIVILAIYSFTPENLKMIELNYGNGNASDSTAIRSDTFSN
jgi:hypothetical protein